MKDTITVDIPVSAETVSRTINLPAYRKGRNKFIKVINADNEISVYSFEDQFGISNYTYSKCGTEALTDRELMDCTAEEFEKAFEAVQDKISNLSIEHA